MKLENTWIGNVIAICGKNTIPILCLHVIINAVLESFIGIVNTQGKLVYYLIGYAIGYLKVGIIIWMCIKIRLVVNRCKNRRIRNERAT